MSHLFLAPSPTFSARANASPPRYTRRKKCTARRIYVLPFCSLTWSREPIGHVRAQAGSDCAFDRLNRPRPKGPSRWRDGLLIANGSRLHPPGVGPWRVCLSRARVTNNFSKIFLIVGPHPLWYKFAMTLITQAELKKLFLIDPETGVCTRLNGRPTGSRSQKGYLRTTIHGREYRLHRLVWLWVHGEHPPEGMTIDHINGVKTDNRIANLRLATICQNVAFHVGDRERRNILRDPKGFRVEMIVNGVRYRRRASTLEKAYAVRDEMYAKFTPLADR